MLQDLGAAMLDGDVILNPALVITLTAYALSGLPVRLNDDSVEICHEIFGLMGTFVLPVDLDGLKQMARRDGAVSFRITGVAEEAEVGSGESFHPIVCEVVYKPAG